MDTHCFPPGCGWWYATFVLGGFLAGMATWFIIIQVSDRCFGKPCTCPSRRAGGNQAVPFKGARVQRAGGYQAVPFRRAKKLCIAAQNSSMLARVIEQMEFLPDNIDIEELKLENRHSKPDFSRTNYILCCAETSGRGIILSDTEPDQLGAIVTHAENAKAHCAILVHGTQDPEEGGLYDKSQLNVMVKSQPKLKAYIDAGTLFSFRSKLNKEQENAIEAWLRHRN